MHKLYLVFETANGHTLHKQEISNVAAVPLVGDVVAIGPNEFTVQRRIFAPHADNLTDIIIVFESAH